MNHYTVHQFAEILGKTPGHIVKLIQENFIRAKKLDPTKKTSPYVILKEDGDRYLKSPVKLGRRAKRCEPCDHPKKRCKRCNRDICRNDFHYQVKSKGLLRPYCKDCD